MNQAIRNILIIEDDRFIGEMYVRSLRKQGYEVDWFLSGADGRNAALAKHYDLILLDIMLPEERGTDILSSLRTDSEDRIPGSRIIVLTNFDQDEESKAAMQAHADAYLIKADITPRRLMEIIDTLK